MLRLEGLAARDGWALVRDGDDLWVTRPPHARSGRTRILPAQVPMLTQDGGFRIDPKPFESWSALVHHVRRQCAKAQPPFDRAAALAAVQRLDARGLRRQLDRVEAWISDGQLERARVTLDALGTAKVLDLDASLRRRCQALTLQATQTRVHAAWIDPPSNRRGAHVRKGGLLSTKRAA